MQTHAATFFRRRGSSYKCACRVEARYRENCIFGNMAGYSTGRPLSIVFYWCVGLRSSIVVSASSSALVPLVQHATQD